MIWCLSVSKYVEILNFIHITEEIPNINLFRPPVYMHLSFFKIKVFGLILNQQLKFAGRWKNVPIVFLKTNSNIDFVLYLSHIRKCSNSGYQIISFCSAFLGTIPCVAWSVLKDWFAFLCQSLKLRNSSKIILQMAFEE